MAAVDHPPVTARTRWLLAALLVPLLAAVAVGAVLLWPSGGGPSLRATGTPLDATITALRDVACSDTAPEAQVRCIRPEARLATGGLVALTERAAGDDGDLAVGDEVVVAKTGPTTFALAAHRRDAPLAALAALAALLVLLVGRRRGALVVAALAVSALVVVGFAVPAVLDGGAPLGVGVVGAALVAVAVVVVGRGPSARSVTALIGALCGIGIAGLVAEAVVSAAHLAGLDATPTYLDVRRGSIPTSGLLVAGLVLGTVGALVDLALRQVDATWDLRDTDPGARWRGIAAAGMRRGREHLADVAATVVLAYAGAALPVFVLLAAGDQPILDALRGEVVAVEVARALAALVALAAAVPLTAALAAAVVVREAGARAPADPRRFRSRAEREIWDSDERG